MDEHTRQSGPEEVQSLHSGTASSVPEERTLIEVLLYYLTILLQYKWLIIGITVLAAVGVVSFSIVSLRLPPEESPLPNYYRAYATLLVSEDRGSASTQGVLSALGLDVPGGSGMNYGRLAQEVLRSRSFLDDIIAEHDIVKKYGIEEEVRSRSREVVLANTTISFSAETGILTVGYQSIYPDFARDVANTMVRNLQEWFRSRGGLTRMEELRSLEQKIAEVEADIVRLESDILSFQRQYGMLTIEEIADSQSLLLSDLQNRLVDLEVQIRNQRSISRIQEDPALVRLQAQRNTVIGLINEIEEGYTAGARSMPPRDALPQLALQFRGLESDLEIKRRIYQALSEQYEVARLTAESAPVFTVLELAEVPDRKEGPSRGQLSVLFTVGAFAVAVVLALLLHFVRSAKADLRKKNLLSP